MKSEFSRSCAVSSENSRLIVFVQSAICSRIRGIAVRRRAARRRVLDENPHERIAVQAGEVQARVLVHRAAGVRDAIESGRRA